MAHFQINPLKLTTQGLLLNRLNKTYVATPATLIIFVLCTLFYLFHVSNFTMGVLQTHKLFFSQWLESSEQ